MADFIAKGPLFDGRAQVNIRAWIDESVQTISFEAARDVQTLGMSQYREPTGYYSSRVQPDRISEVEGRVHDNMVVYGPWLEGVGSRNATTRFKGYRTWRITGQKYQRRAAQIAIRVLKSYLPRMN